MKEIGVLLPIFSLPSKYGIGDFGYEAYKFIDILNNKNMQYWEILPINATFKYPYSPISYYALNIEYISIDKLIEEELLEKSEVEEIPSSNRIKYNNKEKYYKIAYNRFIQKGINNEFEQFKSNTHIKEYAEFMHSKTGQEIDYFIFLQFILDKQWNELLNYAHEKNVKIIGDMPIYPAFESVEVMYNKECYQLKDGKQEYVAGVPGDAQYPDGQIWGNPVYNCEYLKQNNYKYLIERYTEFLKRYDVVRIDHFIGYDKFYKIPIDKNSSEGIYEQGAGEEFFDELIKIVPSDRFIVEDLGLVKETTIILKEKYNFIGSNIVQCSIDIKNMMDLMINCENVVLYTGTHDCNTLVGWYNELSFVQKLKIRAFLCKYGCINYKINKSIIDYCVKKSKANIVIIPIQDILGLDSSARINVPGKDLETNWTWKLENFKSIII